MCQCARLHAITVATVISMSWPGVVHGHDLLLPMNGLFYGVDGPIDSVGNSKYRYRSPIGYRFEAESDGKIVAVRWSNRYNRGSETGYSAGNGGTILLEVRKDDPSLEHPPLAPGGDALAPLPQNDPNLLAKTAVMGPATRLGSLPIARLTEPVPVKAGQRYWLVFNQLDRKNYVSINSAYIYSAIPTNEQGPGGPYYGDEPRIALSNNGNWLHSDGSPAKQSRHLVQAQFLYSLPDGQEIWSGFGSIYAHPSNGDKGARRAFNAAQPIRQRFTPSQPTFSMAKLYLRAYRMQGKTTPGSLEIELLCNSAVVGKWSVPASSFPISKVAHPPDREPPHPPIPFTAIDLGQPVTIKSGLTYYLKLSTRSGSYYIHAQQMDLRSFKSRNTFSEGWAEYSTNKGKSWQGWHISGKNRRRDMVLPFMFEVLR
jgi:hypothetical protein